MTTDILTEIDHIGMIPVLSIDRKERALPLARALQQGGLPLMEVMFRTEAAADSIRQIAREMPDFLVGAGTVLTVDQAQQAIDCGAKFLVAPGFNLRVVKFAVDAGVPMVPGCISPTEVELARDLGLKVLKFFPAVESGGRKAMGLLSGPYPDVRFVPTGDLTRDLVREYLPFEKVAACGGDFMLSYADIYADNYQKIAQDTHETIQEYLNFQVMIAGGVDNSALSTLLGSSLQPADDHVIGTRDVERAFYYLKRSGVNLDEGDVLRRSAFGRITAFKLKEKQSGFDIIVSSD